MSDSQIEEIKAKLNIADVISEYVQLKRVGANFRARCPFHQEKTPSFYVTPSRQIWHCFGCGLGGDVISFVQQIESLEFTEALERLAVRAGVELARLERTPLPQRRIEEDRKRICFELNNLAARYYREVLQRSKSADDARQYLKDRNFTTETVEQWNIGYAPDAWTALYDFLKKRGYADADIDLSGLVIRKDGGGFLDRFRDRIIFPILDMAGQTAGFSARILHPKENTGKYINSPETVIYNKSKILFGLYQARSEIRKKGEVVVVEGNVDAIKSSQAGVKNVVASSGTAFTEYQMSRLARLADTLVFAFDADTAGIGASRKAVNEAWDAVLKSSVSDFTVKVLTLPQGSKDPDELIDKDSALWSNLVTTAKDYLEFYFENLFGILDVNDPQEKKRAVGDFLSLLVRVPDPIVVNHYVHKIAQAALVREQAVTEVLQKLRGKRDIPVFQKARHTKSSRSAQELGQQRFLGLLCHFPDDLECWTEELRPEFFTDEQYRRVMADILAYKTRTGNLIIESFLDKYPQDRTIVAEAIFAAEAIQADQEFLRQELREVFEHFRSSYYHRLHDQISLQIRTAEAGGDRERMNALVQEFNKVTSSIRNLELKALAHGNAKKEEGTQ